MPNVAEVSFPEAAFPLKLDSAVCSSLVAPHQRVLSLIDRCGQLDVQVATIISFSEVPL